jgi:hypothetical protein
VSHVSVDLPEGTSNAILDALYAVADDFRAKGVPFEGVIAIMGALAQVHIAEMNCDDCREAMIELVDEIAQNMAENMAPRRMHA